MTSATPSDVLAVGHGFWNLRGSFRIGGVLNIGNQCSLVQRKSGRYLLLDACNLSEGAQRWLDAQTENGAAIEAILHLHPFHTLSVRGAKERYPHAKVYGTARHHRRASELTWQQLCTDSDACHALFSDDLEFTVPRGVQLIPENENLHFSSVLAIHPASKSLHVDDTLTYVRLPKLLSGKDVVRFHPTLAQTLEPRPGAASEFRAWAQELITRCAPLENLCAAHSAAELGAAPGHIASQVAHAFTKVESKLARHEAKWG